MRREIIVGDVHATPEELGDCQSLMDYIRELAVEYKASVLFLGDQYHTHNVIRAEVMAFWIEAFRAFDEDEVLVAALVGNHDYAGEGSAIHALMAHQGQIDVIDSPQVRHDVLYMPYYSDVEKFVADAVANPVKTVVCHQTFAGSKYENGFYAPDGIDPNLLPQETVISGHIHSPQSFGKVTYIGAPRWRSLNDANLERAVWLYKFDGGEVVDRTPFSTGEVCRQIKFRIDSPENPIDEALDPRYDWRVDIRGPEAWVDKRKVELAGPRVRVRTFKESAVTPTVRESEGIGAAFGKYLSGFKPRFETPAETLRAMAEDRLHV